MVIIRSIMVWPAGGSTPPTITSPTSPSAWQPTTFIARRECIVSSHYVWVLLRPSRLRQVPAEGGDRVVRPQQMRDEFLRFPISRGRENVAVKAVERLDPRWRQKSLLRARADFLDVLWKMPPEKKR